MLATLRGATKHVEKGRPESQDEDDPSSVVFRSGGSVPRAVATREPDADEAGVLAAVREVYAGKITAERLSQAGRNLVLTITAVPGQPFVEADFNLTSLGREVRNGLTPVNLRQVISPPG